MSIFSKLSTLMLLPLMIAVATNPTPRQYQRYLHRKTCQLAEPKSWVTQITCEILDSLPEPTRGWIVTQHITRHNYWLFSVYVIDSPTLYDKSLGIVGSFFEVEQSTKNHVLDLQYYCKIQAFETGKLTSTLSTD